MQESKVYNIAGLAKALGSTESSIRNYIHARNWDAIPEPFPRGGLIQWLVADVDKWLAEKAAMGYTKEKVRKRGRPRLIRIA